MTKQHIISLKINCLSNKITARFEIVKNNFLNNNLKRLWVGKVIEGKHLKSSLAYSAVLNDNRFDEINYE